MKEKAARGMKTSEKSLSQCFPEAGDNGSRRERGRDIPECPVLSFRVSAGTDVSFSYLDSSLECVGSCPGSCTRTVVVVKIFKCHKSLNVMT